MNWVSTALLSRLEWQPRPLLPRATQNAARCHKSDSFGMFRGASGHLGCSQTEDAILC